jgi:hypothetical protein
MSFSRVGPNQTIERGQFRVAKSAGFTRENSELSKPKAGITGFLKANWTNTFTLQRTECPFPNVVLSSDESVRAIS